jgi:hypothetical protein
MVSKLARRNGLPIHRRPPGAHLEIPQTEAAHRRHDDLQARAPSLMLTSLLPGLRELRAPLASGYLWLVALGLIVEPHVPDRAEATGLMASVYRLTEGLSSVGLGVAATFAAYLIGSLSLALGSTPLRKLMPSTLDSERAGPWNAIPSGSLNGLMQVARETRERLEDLVSLSDTSLEAELNRLASSEASVWVNMRSWRPSGKILPPLPSMAEVDALAP